MTPVFSEPEYRRLMMLAFLGEWMLNAIRKDPDPDYEDTVAKIYSYAQNTSLEPLVAYDGEGETWVPTEAFEDEAHAFIDQYDDKTFWEELTARMTERDLLETYGERAVGGMRPEQRVNAADPIAKAYAHEFEDSGLDRLRVDESEE